MIQCSECEFFHRGPGGQVSFRCDPFSTIKEPECVAKWQLLRSTELSQKIERMVSAYEATLELYRRMAPLQEKMFRHMEREIDDAEEADSWKFDDYENEDDDGDSEGLEDDPAGGPYT